MSLAEPCHIIPGRHMEPGQPRGVRVTEMDGSRKYELACRSYDSDLCRMCRSDASICIGFMYKTEADAMVSLSSLWCFFRLIN